MIFLAITTDTWIVTGLGFGIVLLLLFFLIYVMKFFGWTMQKIEAPKEPKAKSEAPKAEPVEEKKTVIPEAPKPVEASPEDDTVAIAYALYLAQHLTHDHPTAMIHLHPHASAWHIISTEMNNQVF